MYVSPYFTQSTPELRSYTHTIRASYCTVSILRCLLRGVAAQEGLTSPPRWVPRAGSHSSQYGCKMDAAVSTVSSDDELENELFASMDHAATHPEAITADEEVAHALQEEEYRRELHPPGSSVDRRFPSKSSNDRCFLSMLPDELIRRCFAFVTVATLIATVRLTNKRFMALAISDVHERTQASLYESLVAGFDSDANAGASAAGDISGESAMSAKACVTHEAGMSLDGSSETCSSTSAASSSGPSTISVSPDADRRFAERLGAPPRLDRVQKGHLLFISFQLEAELCATPELGVFSRRVRSLCFNLRDRNNPELRQRVASGALSPAELVRMSSREMASTLQKRQRSEWHARSLACAIKADTRRAVGHATDLYRCDSCGGRSTQVHRVIRPGRAVDRARTYATCSECNARWEV